jgi:alpha-amylase/alpha-mannosidase (GH57 family)
MHDVSLALVWHQHQPYYPDDLSGENPMPWVRLHGTKDYWGMAMLLGEVPEMRVSVNLAPSLLKQILAYTRDGAEDAHLRVSRLPADALSEQDVHYLLDNFFMAHFDLMIRPMRRYRELHHLRNAGVDSARQAARRFRKRDLVDLQCWSNLVWFHPLAFERDRELAEFRDKGRHWSEDEKQWLLDKQMALLGEVIPLHRKLAESGQVELTTTPFYHPILPLLADKRQAREAMPGVTLPEHLEGYPDDVRTHVQRALAYHERLFGERPRGMWPAEGSVSQGIVAEIARAGIEWIATDEEILSCSTNGWVARDAHGHLRNPEMLYRPWRVEEGGRQLQIVFRDHALSDQIGFHYQRFQSGAAVDDFLAKVEGIGRATTANAGHRPTLLTVILDGENCWEYYPDAGVDFLRAFYRRIVKHPKITPTRVSDYLERHPATDKVARLFPGSWISHNFGIWIGHPECNRAWDLLHETRMALVAAEHSREKSPEQLAAAWEELYIAQGSDWFWWYGDSHTSAQDHVFDHLFRRHLQNVYALLSEPVPNALLHPIKAAHAARRLHTDPTGLLSVKLDGRQTYFEWLAAGVYLPVAARGTMTMAEAPGRIGAVRFGYDGERLLVRLDGHQRTAAEALAEVDALRIVFLEPEGFELRVDLPGAKQPACELWDQDAPVRGAAIRCAVDAIFELAVPCAHLKVRSGDAVQFSMELVEQGQTIERLPAEGVIETVVPVPEFELMMWQV